MNKYSKTMPGVDIARSFMNETAGESLIARVFDDFDFDCLAMRGIDPNELDEQIKQFEKSDYEDAETLGRVIDLVRQGFQSAHAEEEELLESLKRYLAERYTEDLTLTDLAAEFHVSAYYLCHFFKTRTGVSVKRYLNRMRVERAIGQLLRTNDKIVDIATACGFNNASYFTEVFTKTVGASPSRFREEQKDLPLHPFYSCEDILIATRFPRERFLREPLTKLTNRVAHSAVCEPDEQFSFLHETAIIEHKGVLYTSWYHCAEDELEGYTPICGRRSYDGGKTWTEREVIAEDPSGRILYCPPVYGVCDGKLYLLINEMVAADFMHALDLYVLNEATDRFELVWSRPIPFKLNTNVVTLPNGKLMLPGRIAEPDGFPNTPAVLISDSGKIDSDWRLVKVAENGDLPGGKKLVHPETTVLCEGETLWLFNRNDQCHPPLVYVSHDYGETWSGAATHDIPYIASKIYSGTLSDGRHFLIANTYREERSKLTVFFTEKKSMIFTGYIDLFDTEHTDLTGVSACHYPAAVEYDGKLYIIATKNYGPGWFRRGAELFTVEL